MKRLAEKGWGFTSYPSDQTSSRGLYNFYSILVKFDSWFLSEGHEINYNCSVFIFSFARLWFKVVFFEQIPINENEWIPLGVATFSSLGGCLGEGLNMGDIFSLLICWIVCMISALSISDCYVPLITSWNSNGCSPPKNGYVQFRETWQKFHNFSLKICYACMHCAFDKHSNFYLTLFDMGGGGMMDPQNGFCSLCPNA